MVIGLTRCNAKESKTDTTQEVVAGIEEDEVAKRSIAIIYENTSTLQQRLLYRLQKIFGYNRKC